MNNRLNCPLDNLSRTKVMEITEKEGMQQELERQLHEQYAINNNAKVSSFVSFIVALFALFGFYGYMYANTTVDFSKNGEFVVGTNQYTLDVFFLMSFVVCGILFFLTLLSLQLGYSQRRDQIIIHRIREFSYKNADHSMTEIFGNQYNPRGKSRSEFIVGYFNLFYWLFLCGQGFVFITSIIKIGLNIHKPMNTECSCWGLLVFIILLLELIFVITSLHKRCCDYYSKYESSCQ